MFIKFPKFASVLANLCFAALMLATIGIFLVNQSRMLYYANTDPFYFKTVTAIRSVLKPGDPITIRYEFFRSRYCETDLNLFVIDHLNNDVVWRNRVTGGATLLGYTVVNNTFILPEFPEGQYSFRTITHSRCADDSHTTPAPEVPFEVRK